MRFERTADLLEASPTLRPVNAPPPEPIGVDIRGLTRTLGSTAALRGVDLSVRPGELLALLGPSGSGKTTLLRLIAGLDRPDAGVIAYAGEDVTRLPAARRQVGFVFQNYALFRHMSVEANVAFGLDIKPRRLRTDRAKRRETVGTLLGLVGLPGFESRRPASLSGGQRQRVALARALAVSPRLLLLDEPFGALDALVRKTLRRELRRIHDAAGVTTVFVTHDQEEALELADRVAVLNNGVLEQIGAPEEILEHPRSAFVAGFIGQSSEIRGQIEAGVFRADGARLPAEGKKEGPASVFVRPDEVEVCGPEEPGVDAILLRAAPTGGLVRLECALRDGRFLEVLVPRSKAPPAEAFGTSIRLRILGGRVFSEE